MAWNKVYVTVGHTALGRTYSVGQAVTTRQLVAASGHALHQHAYHCLSVSAATEKLQLFMHTHKQPHMPTIFPSAKLFETVHHQNFLEKQNIWSPVFRENNCMWRCLSTSESHSYSAKWDSKGETVVENENEYFHAYLESVEEYHPYLLSFSTCGDTDTLLSNETVSKLLEEVKDKPDAKTLLLLLSHWSSVAVTEGCSLLSNKAFSQTATLLHRHVQLFSTEEILKSLVYLNKLGFRQNMLTSEPRRNRIILSKAFDQACCQKIAEMNVKQLLLASDFFYSVRGSAFVEFPLQMCKRLLSEFLPSMTKAELMVCLFHASLARRAPPATVQAAVDQLLPYMGDLRLHELAIINLAHYKTQALVRHPQYFDALTARLTDSAEALAADPLVLCAVLKYQHRSVNRAKGQALPHLFSALRALETPLLPAVATGLDSQSVTRVLRVYYSLDLLSQQLFMATVRRVLLTSCLHDWRLKDIARVLHILSNVPLGGERTQEAVAAMLSELQRRRRGQELRAHPQHLLHVAVSCTFTAKFPPWLLAEVFSPAVLPTFTASGTDYSQQLHHLWHSVRIEAQSYQGPMPKSDSLPNLPKKRVYKKLSERAECAGVDVPGLSHRDLTLLQLMEALAQIRPRSSPVPTFLLPHFSTADVEIVHRQKDRGSTSKKGSHSDTDFEREAVVLHASNAYQTVRLEEGCMVPLLRQYHAMRARQLRAQGMTVIEVPHFEFEASTNKQQYLLEKFQQEKEREKEMKN